MFICFNGLENRDEKREMRNALTGNEGKLLFKALLYGMVIQGEFRFRNILSREMCGRFSITDILSAFICNALPFDDQELMLTAVALRAKFVATILFFAGNGSKTVLTFEEIPDTYIRDFVPLLCSYYRLFKTWKEHDTTPEIAALLESLRIALDIYDEARELQDRDEMDVWQKYVISLRNRIVILFPRIGGGRRMIHPVMLADLCMYMPDQTRLLFSEDERPL